MPVLLRSVRAYFWAGQRQSPGRAPTRTDSNLFGTGSALKHLVSTAGTEPEGEGNSVLFRPASFALQRHETRTQQHRAAPPASPSLVPSLPAAEGRCQLPQSSAAADGSGREEGPGPAAPRARPRRSPPLTSSFCSSQTQSGTTTSSPTM